MKIVEKWLNSKNLIKWPISLNILVQTYKFYSFLRFEDYNSVFSYPVVQQFNSFFLNSFILKKSYIHWPSKCLYLTSKQNKDYQKIRPYQEYHRRAIIYVRVGVRARNRASFLTWPRKYLKNNFKKLIIGLYFYWLKGIFKLRFRIFVS